MAYDIRVHELAANHMKTISVSQARSDLERVLDAAQKERIVVTRAGKPSVVIVGIESYDAKDRALASSAEFWGMIEQRRRGRSISLRELKSRLEARERRQPSKSASGGRKTSGKSRRPRA
jgi:prevent-host-death family protein